MLTEKPNGLGVQRNEPDLVRLGTLLLGDVLVPAHVVAPDPQDSLTVRVLLVEVDFEIVETKRTHLAAADARGHDEPDEHSPVIVHAECGLDQPGGFAWR